MKYRDMKDAPRDGTPIILFHVLSKKPYIAMYVKQRAETPDPNGFFLPWVSSLLDHSWPEEAFLGWIPVPDTETVSEQEYKILGLEAELKDACEVLWRSGKREYVRNNYPAFAKEFEKTNAEQSQED